MILRGQEHKGELASHELAELLLAQRATLRQAQERRRDLREHIEAFETQYGIRSEELPEKLASGEIQETLAVCDWLQSLTLLERLESE